MTITPFPVASIAERLAQLRAAPPLVHCLTNEVVQEITANAVLALGASPAMVVAEEEVAEFAAAADALLINIGTVYSAREAAMRAAVSAANEAATPWVFDPVAVGALAYRSRFARELLEQKPTAIRGNASEILALSGRNAAGRGADSADSSDVALDAAIQLAQETDAVVAVTGATDYITDGEKTYSLPYGNILMTRVTGTGCALSAVVAAFCAQKDHTLDAVAAACAVVALAGGDAARRAQGPGSFVPLFIDTLYRIRPDHLEEIVHARA
ncbi:MAG: hydroxyethylthiazole kinase [Burkholderiales bacterium]|jgi:hydroxyethylthiazole kinase|nr:hydroxyethylthiazole kinase [Burkholderiales bacterium]